MKNIQLSIIFIIIFVSACSAQKKITLLKDNSIVKTNLHQYKIDKSQGGASIESLSNKFINIKQNSPNLPLNVNLNFLRKIDLVQLTKICSEVITTEDLVKLTKIKNSGILIDMKSDLYGNVLDVRFFTADDSILTINQIEQIEVAIKKSSKIIIIKPEAQSYLKGSNFISNNVTIWFLDMLKLKKGS